MPYAVGGAIGDLTFFYKAGNPEVAKNLKTVYDVVNDRFKNDDVRQMCDLATVVTCSSEAMRRRVKEATGRDAVVIPDCYENEERTPRVQGDRVVWFGHQANIFSLKPYADVNPFLYTGERWTLEGETKAIGSAAVILLTGSNPGASANRAVKAIRAGRFAVAPEDCPESWKELSDFMWIGDVREGIKWALSNREEACCKVLAGQSYVRNRFSPQSIGSQWAGLFASTLGRDTSTKPAGSVSISR
jgi:hypothetical protein